MKSIIQQLKNPTLFIIICLSILTITACNYSPNALKKYYNDLGSQYVRELKQLGSYTSAQRAMLDTLGKNIIVWHRKNRLPAYARLIQSITSKLESSAALSDDDFLALVKLYWGYPHHNESHSNNLQLARIAVTLSGKQVIQITKQIQKNTRNFSERQQQGSWEGKIKRGARAESEFFTDYLQINLTKSQIDIFLNHYQNLTDPKNTLIKVNEEWNNTLVQLLNKRQDSGFIEKFANHLKNDNLHKRQLQAAPIETRHNEQVAVEMYKALLSSLTKVQRITLLNKLKSISKTLNELIEMK